MECVDEGTSLLVPGSTGAGVGTAAGVEALPTKGGLKSVGDTGESGAAI